MTAAADRHLRLGLLALQNGLIDQVQFVAAFQARTRDKARSPADHLEARGDRIRPTQPPTSSDLLAGALNRGTTAPRERWRHDASGSGTLV